MDTAEILKMAQQQAAQIKKMSDIFTNSAVSMGKMEQVIDDNPDIDNDMKDKLRSIMRYPDNIDDPMQLLEVTQQKIAQINKIRQEIADKSRHTKP